VDTTQYERLYGNQAILIAIIGGLGLVVAIVAATLSSSPGPSRRRRQRLACLAVFSAAGALLTAVVALTPGSLVGRALELNILGAFARSGGSNGYSVYSQMVGNVLMLTWVGLFLPALFRRLTFGSTVLQTFALSVGIEVSQYVFALGRVASVQDLALNVIGGIGAAALGVYVVRPWASGPEVKTPDS